MPSEKFPGQTPKIDPAPTEGKEGVAEQIPTKEAVLSALSGSLEGVELRVSRELYDEHGLVLLEVEQQTETLGEIVEYNYTRKGIHRRQEGGIEKEVGSVNNDIHVTYYQDGMPISGAAYAIYDESAGTWKVIP